jgi:hypothetical protein
MEKIKAAFKWIKDHILIAGIVALTVLTLLFFNKIKTFIFGGLQHTTDKLREAKEKNDKNTYTATKTGVDDQSSKANRSQTTQQVADQTIAENNQLLFVVFE